MTRRPWLKWTLLVTRGTYSKKCGIISVWASQLNSSELTLWSLTNRPTDRLTDQLTPWSRFFLGKLTVTQIVKKFPASYRTKMVIILFTTLHQWFLSQTRCIQFIPSHPISLRTILILYSKLCVGLPSGIFPSSFPNKILYAFLISPMCAACPDNLYLLGQDKGFQWLTIFITNHCWWWEGALTGAAIAGDICSNFPHTR